MGKKKKAKERRKEKRQQEIEFLKKYFEPFSPEYRQITQDFSEAIKYGIYGGEPLPEGKTRKSIQECLAQAFKMGRKMKKAGWPKKQRVFIPFHLNSSWVDGWESVKYNPYRSIDDRPDALD